MPLSFLDNDEIFSTDEALNASIQEYLNSDYYLGDPVTVSEWRIENYKLLRKKGHPDLADIIDAQRKIRDGDPDGQVELDALDAMAAAVKARFPKE